MEGSVEALDERKAAILRAIVEQYVASAVPVGSATVTRTADLSVSAATVRNDMATLEREGFIAQPHTSAGRVPTDRGYRYYVDHLAGATLLAVTERRRIAEFFTSATMAMDELLLQTSHLLGTGQRARGSRRRAADRSGCRAGRATRPAPAAGAARRRHTVERLGREAGRRAGRGRLRARRRDRERAPR